jgi:hypothetical protein
MKRSLARWLAITIAGFFAPTWWALASGLLTLAFFNAAGKPIPPDPLAYASIVVPQAVLGFIVGLVIGYIAKRPTLAWLTFWAALAVGSTWSDGADVTYALAFSIGTWTFLVTTLAGALASRLRANNSFKPKPLRGSA